MSALRTSLSLALALSTTVDALKINPSRTSTITMGAAVGDKFPAEALSKFGVTNKKAVVFFYGADDAPSCSKQIAAMDEALPDFTEMGVKVVGVRNPAGVKQTDASVTLAVDEEDAVRNELEIPKDFFVLGGRQSYVVDATGTIQSIHNNQFDPESHVTVALEAAKELPSASPFPFELPDFSSLFAGSKEE